MKTLRVLPLAILAVSALLAVKMLAVVTGEAPVFGVAEAAAEGAAAPPPTDPLADIEPAPTPELPGVALDVTDIVDIDAALGLPAAAGGDHGESAEADAGHEAAAPEGEAVADTEEPAAEGHGEAAEPAAAEAEAPPQDMGEIFPASASEASVLESLSARRQDLERRASELDLRESLLAAAEARIEGRIAELRTLEDPTGTGAAGVSAAPAEPAEQLAGLVTMYQTMGPKDAAAVFEGLSPSVLLPLARQMNPRKMAAILAEMSPRSAAELTALLAGIELSSPQPVAAASFSDLPQIQAAPAQ
jgi:flagellar motility protein MotE (MotC chaperone)